MKTNTNFSIDEVVDYLAVEHRIHNIQELIPTTLYFTDKISMIKHLTLYNMPNLSEIYTKEGLSVKKGSEVNLFSSTRYILIDKNYVFVFNSKTDKICKDIFTIEAINSVYLSKDNPYIILNFDNRQIKGDVLFKFRKLVRRDEFLGYLTAIYKIHFKKHLLSVNLDKNKFEEYKTKYFNKSVKSSDSSGLSKKSNTIKSILSKVFFSGKQDPVARELDFDEKEEIMNKSFEAVDLQDELSAINQWEKSLEERGSIFIENERKNSVIIEGFAMKRKGKSDYFDLKYFLVTNRQFLYYNTFLEANFDLSVYSTISVDKVSSKGVQISNIPLFSHNTIGKSSRMRSLKKSVLSMVRKKQSYGKVLKKNSTDYNNSRNFSQSFNDERKDSYEKNFIDIKTVSINLEFDTEESAENWFGVLTNLVSSFKSRDSPNKSCKRLESWVNLSVEISSKDDINLSFNRRYIVLHAFFLNIFGCKDIKNDFIKKGRITTAPSSYFKGLTRSKNQDFSDLYVKTGKTFNKGLEIRLHNKFIDCRFERKLERDFWATKLKSAWSDVKEKVFKPRISKNFIKAFREIAPEGPTAAFIFTEIVNKSSLWKVLGITQSNLLLDQHEKQLRKIALKYSCYEVKMENDSFFLVAQNLKDALHFSLEVIVESRRNNDNLTPKLKIGVKFGNVEKIERSESGRIDYYGNEVNIAARLKDFAKEDQIVISASELELVKDLNPRAENLGSVMLKGLHSPQKLFNLLSIK